MKLSQAELILSLPTTIFSIISFFAALYIAISAWLMHKVRVKRFRKLLINNNSQSQNGISSSYSASISSQNNVIYSPSQFHSNFYERPELICHHIFWMSICDSLFSLWNLFIWFPKLFHFNFIDKSIISCKIFGIIEQFIMSSGVLWYLMVAWCLCSVLFGSLSSNISGNTSYQNYLYWNRLKKIHHFFVWSIALICTLIPLYPFDEYGKYENVSRDDVDDNDTECWLKNQIYFISFYGLVGISLLFAIGLLIYISWRWSCPLLRLCKHKSTKKYRCGIRFICCPQLCKKRRRKRIIQQQQQQQVGIDETPQSLLSDSSTSIDNNHNIIQYSSGYVFGGVSFNDGGDMISRIELFTIIFILVWIGPFSVRIYNVFCGINCIAPIWATAIHHYGISLLGFGNAIVWSKSKNFNSPFNSYKEINQQAIQQKEEEIVGTFHRAFSNI